MENPKTEGDVVAAFLGYKAQLEMHGIELLNHGHGFKAVFTKENGEENDVLYLSRIDEIWAMTETVAMLERIKGRQKRMAKVRKGT